MVSVAYQRRWLNWIGMGCWLLALLGGLLFCWICLRCSSGLLAGMGIGGTVLVLPSDAQYSRGCDLMAEGKPAEAVEAFNEAIKISPQLARPYIERASAFKQLGRLDEALADYTAALGLDATRPPAYCGRAAAYLDQGSPELAVPDLTEALGIAPNLHQAVYLRARARLAQGEYEEAIADAEHAIRLDATRGGAFHVLGSALLAMPRPKPDEAVKCLATAIRLEPSLTTVVRPELAEAYYAKAVKLASAGKQAEAEDAFRAAEGLETKYLARHLEYVANHGRAENGKNVETRAKPPKDPVLVQKLTDARTLLDQKRFDEARDAYADILRTDPKDVDALCGRGSAFLGKNDADAALPDFTRAIALDPTSAEAYCLRGRADMKKGDYFRAITDITDAIRLNPDFADPYLYRAGAYCKEDLSDRALADVDEAVKLDLHRKVPTLNSISDRARASYVAIYESEARKENAARHWQKAIESLKNAISRLKAGTPVDSGAADRLNRELAQACQNLGLDRLAAKHWDEAIESFNKAISLDKGSSGQLNRHLAQAYAERGFDHGNRRDFSSAVRDLNTAFGLDANNAEIYRLGGLTCCKMARDCHDRGRIADEIVQRELAVKYLKRAIWLDYEVEYEVHGPLEDAKRNLRGVLGLGG